MLFIIEGGGMSTESFNKQITISEDEYVNIVNTEVDKRYDEVRLADKVSLTKG